MEGFPLALVAENTPKLELLIGGKLELPSIYDVFSITHHSISS